MRLLRCISDKSPDLDVVYKYSRRC